MGKRDSMTRTTGSSRASPVSETLRRWAIMTVDGTPLEEIKAFHREHHQSIVDEVIRYESTPEGSRALKEEIDALRQQIRDSCNGRPTMV
jgi:hypothetical protein